MKPSAALLSFCLLLAGHLSAQETMAIYACVSIPSGPVYSTPARYQELADAGFTTSLSGFDSVPQALAALDAAQTAGVTVWVLCPELETDIAYAVSSLKVHPAFAGYHLTDEPSAAAFDALGARVRAIQALDTSKPCYINLLPIYASPALLGTATYAEYIEQFIAKVPVPIISFDHYPTNNGYLDRLRVLPGITGLAQVNFPPDTDLDSVRRKLVLDLEYISTASPSLDFRILLSTMLRIFGRGTTPA